MNDVISLLMLFSIPLVAITGGIIVGVVKSIGQQRLLELMQRERMLAIERGIPIDKLPPLNIASGLSNQGLTFAQSQRRRSQGLFIAGMCCVATGIAMVAFLQLIPDTADKNLWAIGLIPLFVGVALLLSSWVVRPRREDWDREQPGTA